MKMFFHFTLFWAVFTLFLVGNLWYHGYDVRIITLSASIEMTAKEAWLFTVAYNLINYFSDKILDKMDKKLKDKEAETP